VIQWTSCRIPVASGADRPGAQGPVVPPQSEAQTTQFLHRPAMAKWWGSMENP